ncbi:hypothetical protein GIB67_009462 [Kingdonia uniflora]|uniref:Shikimate kinase n=1 Tax=Kingdonia uniflora TaxID=39325 RepID=A0A7J7N377_9MAGN|nr:hypothetical protein GIB67_009462 [Kingdonia uniflora]
MEISVIQSSCRLCSPVLHFKLCLNSLSYTKTIRLHRSPLSITTPSFRRTTGLRCSVEDEFPGVDTKTMVLNPSLSVKNKAVQIASDLKGTSIFLVGMNGTMKTYIGKVLADALRYCFFDSDSLVGQASAVASEFDIKSLRERDEEGFRVSETEVLRQLSSMGRLLVCTGDQAVWNSTNLSFLRDGISIWIDVPIEILVQERIQGRSESFTEVSAELIEIYEKMRDGYATADAIISLQKVASQFGYNDTDSVTVEEMALQTLTKLENLTRVKKLMEAAARPF